MKRLVAACAAAAIGMSVPAMVGSGAEATTAAAPAAPAVAALDPITWASCTKSGCEGSIRVPIDRDNPGLGTVKIPLSLRKHTKEPFRGLMMGNPGGPGASGRWMSQLGQYIPKSAGDHFDWIGFDPRGVGASKPSLRCNSKYFGVDRPPFRPKTKRLMRYWVRKTKGYARDCGKASASKLLGHLRTLDTVQDIESIRASYIEQIGLTGTKREKLNFYGFSYGTYIAQVYASEHPKLVGRFVLDGVVDPRDYWYKSNLQQDIWFDRNLNTFFRWIAKHPKAFKLGTSGKAIRSGFERQLRKLERKPAAGGRLGPDELTDALLSAAYYVYDWASLASAYSDLVRHGRGRALFNEYRDGNMGNDNGYAMYLATQCTDAPAPRWKTQIADARRLHKKFPFLTWDNTWYNAPCRYWPEEAEARYLVRGGKVKAPILMINETRDAATPFQGALDARRIFTHASLIEGVGGTTHSGSLSGVACVDNRIARYLRTGEVPKRRKGRRSDLECHKVPAPRAGYVGRVQGRVGADLRADLGVQRPFTIPGR